MDEGFSLFAEMRQDAGLVVTGHSGESSGLSPYCLGHGFCIQAVVLPAPPGVTPAECGEPTVDVVDDLTGIHEADR